MSPPITAILDACVLYGARLRSFLMYLAMSDLLWARWTHRIHEEWMRNVLENYPHLTREKLERTRDLMDRHALDAIVTDYEELVASLTLPDPDDRHVLAAAIRAGADAIVTFNLADFPAEVLAEFDHRGATPGRPAGASDRPGRRGRLRSGQAGPGLAQESAEVGG